MTGQRFRLRRLALAVPVLVQDALLAAVLCAIDLRTQWTSKAATRWIGDGPLPWQLVVAYGAVGYAALVWRRRWPELVFVLLLVHSVVAQLILPYRPFLGLLVAFYTVASRMSLARALSAAAATTIALSLTVADEVREVPAGARTETLVVDVILFGVLELTVLLVARWIRRNRRSLDDLETRRRTAVLEERARIARELHDIVAHSVTVMVLQAAGARRVQDGAAPRVRDALGNIETAGHQAMSELRRLLGILVGGEIPARDTTANAESPPGLDDIDAVVARVTAAGLAVTVNREGVPRPLDASVGLAAYRVVAEGLTNALKHAGTNATATVHLCWHDDGLTVSVTDNGRGNQATDAHLLSSGRGLVGLSERIRAVGGVLTAEPLRNGGFRLLVGLPAAELATAGREPTHAANGRRPQPIAADGDQP